MIEFLEFIGFVATWAFAEVQAVWDVVNTISWVGSNILVAYVSFVLVVFILGYFLLFDPSTTLAGKLIFRFMVSLVGVIALIFIAIFVDPSPGREWYTYPGDTLWWRPLARFVAYLYVAYAATSLTALLAIRRWWPHKLKTHEQKELVKLRKQD